MVTLVNVFLSLVFLFGEVAPWFVVAVVLELALEDACLCFREPFRIDSSSST